MKFRGKEMKDVSRRTVKHSSPVRAKINFHGLNKIARLYQAKKNASFFFG